MTMEDRSAGLERAAPATSTTTTISSLNTICDDGSSDASYPLRRTSKRTFDVAFLVAPDENLARRQNEKLRLVSTERLSDMMKVRSQDELTENHQDPDSQERLPQNLTMKQYRRRSHDCTESSLSLPYVSSRTLTPTSPGLSPEPDDRRYNHIRSQKTPSPPQFSQQPQMLLNRCVDLIEPIGLACETPCAERQVESRSAFTKVSLNTPRNGFTDGQTSPRSSISPDRASYQSSVSPPVLPITVNSPYKYSAFSNKMGYPFLMGSDTAQANILDNLKIPHPPRIPSPKLAGFRPDLPQMYSNMPYNSISVFPPMTEALARPRFLATAASVAGLLPQSLAALTLPAQNVCAKCNLSFRMTSDLVYHMRSHHKNESAGEASRRRREEKLRCPVCDESFRERHHLTRHMTAHQDKESDAIVDQVDVKRRAAPIHGK
ncbi:uncharacterized protein LOC117175241 [Belonocnema kinseyi]|uniref:uncharacterized protein LOC117175241 n=1 Tax=Belonocnema kinseyi TaxID=2817044 RepID=UPI00143D954B|nr:uncharacterized protein LOC117175241 [Belonocnema kinseyi]